MKSNYKVITKQKSIYYVITKTLIYYNIITFSLPTLALTFQSPLIEGSLIYGTLNDNEQLFIENQYLNVGNTDKNLFQIPKNKDNQFILAIPQDLTKLKLTLKTPTYSKEKTFLIKSRQWDEEIVMGLQPEKVSPNTKNSERISREADEMRQLRKKSIFDYFPISWIRPVPNYKRISSSFGSRRVLNNIKKQGHSGVDYAAPVGTPVISPAAGKVVYVNPDVYLTGKTVMVDHGYGVFSSYSHLNQINVKQGQMIGQGDPIGQVGNTGRSSGPHLHFTITWYGVRIDPETLFSNNSVLK